MNRLYQLLPTHLRQKFQSDQSTSEVIWFVSFPKSGRTWIELMTAYAISSLSGLDIRETLDNHPKSYRHHMTNELLPFVSFSHGHNNFEICKGNTFPSEFYRGKRVVLLVRDPRDTIISNYYYQKWHHELFDGTVTDFIHYPYQMADDKASRYGIAPMINYMNAWIDNQPLFDDLYVLQYEDMKADIEATLVQYFEHIAMPMSQQLLDDTVAYGSFDNMRKLEESNELGWYALGGAGSEKGFKTRKGKSGDYRQELSIEDIKFIDDYITTHLSPRFNSYHTPA